jgi:hypothetical protein
LKFNKNKKKKATSLIAQLHRIVDQIKLGALVLFVFIKKISLVYNELENKFAVLFYKRYCFDNMFYRPIVDHSDLINENKIL